MIIIWGFPESWGYLQIIHFRSGFSIRNHLFWGTIIYGNHHVSLYNHFWRCGIPILANMFHYRTSNSPIKKFDLPFLVIGGSKPLTQFDCLITHDGSVCMLYMVTFTINKNPSHVRIFLPSGSGSVMGNNLVLFRR